MCHFVNIADEINIICFTEGYLRWFQVFVLELIIHWLFIRLDFHWRHWISINECSWLRKNVILCLVTRHPFYGYPPLLVAEYITSDHANDGIYLFLSQIQKNLLSLVNLSSNMKPKLVMTDFSLAVISGVRNRKEYFEKCFEIIIDKEKIPSKITVVSICSAYLNVFHWKTAMVPWK